MSYRLFLFDLDGTLVDTSPGIMASVRHVEQRLGLSPLPEETLRRFIGPPLEDSFMKYYGADPAQARRMVDVYRERYGVTGFREGRVYPGILEALDAIEAAGCVAAVATLKHHEMAALSLKAFGLGHRFAAVAAGTDQHPSKADLIRQAMGELGWEDPASAVILGDSRYDGVGALEAGVDFAAAAYGFGFGEPGSMDGLDPVFAAESPEALGEFIRRSLPREG